MRYNSLHTKIRKEWGKASKCELCNEKKGSRFEWSNKDHKYSENREDWWMLCSKCHREWDAKTFGKKEAWNKGKRKERPTMICLWCSGYFAQKRNNQLFCSRTCTARRNGNITKRKNHDKPDHKCTVGCPSYSSGHSIDASGFCNMGCC